MGEIMSTNLPLQKEFNQLLSEKAASAMPGKLDGKFAAAACPAGFNYGITYGANAYYNEQTLSTLNSTIQTDKDGIVSVSAQKLSDLLRQVFKSTAFVFSKATQKKLNEWDEAAEAQIASVLSAFTDSGFHFTDPVPPGGKIADVFNQLTEQYGPVTETCDNLPVYLTALKDALATYIEMSNQAYQLHSRASQATAVLNAAIQNATAPTAKNGGLQTGDASYYVAFDKLPTANQLIGSLGTGSNALKIHLSGDSFSSSGCKVHVEGKGDVHIPIVGLLNITASHSSQVDVSEFTSEKTNFSIDITYPGLTTVGVMPLSLSSDNKLGWYAVNILREIQENTGNDNADGYKLLGSEFSVESLFGPKGRLNFLKTFVISREPTIDVVFKEVNVAEFKKHIHTDNSVKVKLFGFISLGSVEHSYTLDKVDSNESEKSVTMHFAAPDVSGTIPLNQQVAYVLGGVPAYT